jgi:hypothetical protein
MSAMPAGWTELSESPRVRTVAGEVQGRADRRAERKEARRSSRRWAIAASTILAVAFGFTVGILELLH